MFYYFIFLLKLRKFLMMNEGCEKSRNCFGVYMMEVVIIY